MTEKRTEEIRIDLDDIIYFLNSSKKPDFSATIIKRSNTIYELIIKNKKNDKSLPIQSKKITIKNTANQENKEKEIFYFPVLKYTSYFKWILKFPKTEYIFLFLHIINDTTIAVFSNNILEYINKASKEEVSWNKSNAISDLDLNEFEKLTSSFYLLCKNEESSYQWKNILSFFPTFLDISLKGNDYKNLIYKIKWDSIALFKSRYMQEKTIKTLILGKQGKHLIHAMFYWNLLKNLTFKIENASIDLNWKWKWWFHITTTKNNDIYFNKIDKIVSKINNWEEGRKSELPIFFFR